MDARCGGTSSAAVSQGPRACVVTLSAWVLSWAPEAVCLAVLGKQLECYVLPPLKQAEAAQRCQQPLAAALEQQRVSWPLLVAACWPLKGPAHCSPAPAASLQAQPEKHAASPQELKAARQAMWPRAAACWLQLSVAQDRPRPMAEQHTAAAALSQAGWSPWLPGASQPPAAGCAQSLSAAVAGQQRHLQSSATA